MSCTKSLVAGTAVVVGNHAALILGSSGTGKSQTAIKMISLGASLIGDDQVYAEKHLEKVILTPVEKTLGKIEARNFGIIEVPYQSEGELLVVLDLNQIETQRFPQKRVHKIFDLEFPLYLGNKENSISEVLFLILKNGNN